jgi:hypothetical protein
MAVVDAKEIGESCPGPLKFGSSVLPVSLDKEDDSSSDTSAWAWTRKKVGASLAKPVDTTGGASCPESQSMKEVFFSRLPSSAMDGAHCQEAMALIEEQEETARAAKRKWQEEWKGPAAGGSNMEKGPRAYQNKLKKDRKNRNYLKKAAHHQLRLEKRRDAEYHAKGESARFRLFVNPPSCPVVRGLLCKNYYIVLSFVIYFGIMGVALDFGNFCLCCSALSTSFVILQGQRSSGSRSYRSPYRSPQGGQRSSGSRSYRSPYRSPQRGYSGSE